MAGSILERIAARDTNAVGECLRTYGGLVWSLARRSLGDAADVEDAVQEIFVSLWQNAPRFDPARAGESTFVAMIARRRLIDRVRRGEARPDLRTALDIGNPGVEPADPSTATDRIDAALDLKRAAAALAELKPDERRVLEMAIGEGRTHSEIAAATGLPLGTVKTNARRGLQRVRDRLRLGRGSEPRARS